MVNHPGFILTLITFGTNLITFIICLVVISIIIYYMHCTRIPQDDKVVLCLSTNIYLLLLALTAIIMSFNIQTLLGDLYQQDFNSLWCIFIGYMFGILFGGLYWSFVNQAFFRLCRIVYSTHRWLQYSQVYIILTIIELVLICIFLCPVLLWHDIVYLPDEHYCYVPFTNIRSTLWLVLNSYGIPLLLLSLIYLHIAIYLRQQPNNQTLVIKQRQQRDLSVIRRIYIMVGLLVALGVPTIVLLLMFYITGVKYPLFDRIAWFSISLAMLELSITLILLTPQLKCIILKKIRPNRVIPFDRTLGNSLTIRPTIAIL